MAKGEFVGQKTRHLVCPECNGLTGLLQSDIQSSSKRLEHSCDYCGTGLVIKIQGNNNEHVEITEAGTQRIKTLVLLRTRSSKGETEYIAVKSGFFLTPDENTAARLQRQKRADKIYYEFPATPLNLEDQPTMYGTKIRPNARFVYMDTVLVPKNTTGYSFQTGYMESFPESPEAWRSVFPQLKYVGSVLSHGTVPN